MTKSVVYLLGGPGAGKSSLMRELVAHTKGKVPRAMPFPHVIWAGGGAHLGYTNGFFPGTDGLSMNIQPKAVDWLLGPAGPEFVLAEGDRLGNEKFFRTLIDAGVHLFLIEVATPPEVAALRRAERARRISATTEAKLQDASWVKGRETKVERLLKKFGHETVDGTAAPEVSAERTLQFWWMRRTLGLNDC